MLRRRRPLVVLLAVAVVAVCAAVAAYALVLRPAGDVSNPEVGFDEPPAGESEPERRGKDTFTWSRYGYTTDHRRAFQPKDPPRPPFRRVWKHTASALLEFPPVIAGNRLYQLADDGRLAAIAKKTGRRKWKRDLGHLAASSPAIVDGTLFVTLLETKKGSGRGRIVALRARDGKIKWSRKLPSRSESSPLVHDGRVFFGSENGTVYALRASNGRTVWTYKAAGAVKASPTLSNGRLYFGDYGGQVQAIRVSDGRRVWRNGEAGGLLRGGEYYATAAVAFGRVFVGSTDSRMYSFSAADGDLAWARATGGYVYSSAAIDTPRGLGPTLYFGSYDGTFYALDARSGKTRWTRRSGGKISGSPTIIGDVVYFADLGRSLTFGLSTRTGRVLFRAQQGGYDPAVSDGDVLYLTGRRTLSRFEPTRSSRRRAERAGKARKARRSSKAGKSRKAGKSSKAGKSRKRRGRGGR